MVGIGRTGRAAHRRAARAAAGLLVTVETTEVGVVGPGAEGLAVTLPDLNLFVAGPVAPGQVLGVADAVGVGVPPAGVTEVGVLGDLVRRTTGTVGLDHALDDVLVEPIGDRVLN